MSEKRDLKELELFRGCGPCRPLIDISNVSESTEVLDADEGEVGRFTSSALSLIFRFSLKLDIQVRFAPAKWEDRFL